MVAFTKQTQMSTYCQSFLYGTELQCCPNANLNPISDPLYSAGYHIARDIFKLPEICTSNENIKSTINFDIYEKVTVYTSALSMCVK